MNATLLMPGMLVASKYELKRPLARGAMGEVWVATHATLGGEMAIKFLSRGPTHDGEDEATAMARFRFEAQVAAKLSRKTRHIAAVTDHGEEYGYAYLVMELIEGESLEKLMHREGRCALTTIAPIIAQVAKGLSHAHADGVFHRDLKPANILLTRDEDGGLLVKILDFGIAKAARSHKVTGAQEPNHSTEIGIVLGTPNYMSPEQARGLSTLDHRCNLWALATIAYESLTTTLPYDGETTADLLVNICSIDPVPPSKHRADLPAAVDAFFDKAFAGSANKRFQNAAELATAFDVVAREPVVAAATATTSAPLPRLELVPIQEERSVTGALELDTYQPPRSRTGLFAVLGALAVVMLLLAIVGISRSSAHSAASPSPPAEPAPTPTQTIAPPVPTETAAPPPAATTASASASVAKAPSKPTTTVHKPITAPTPAPSSSLPSSAPKKPVDKGEIL